MQKTLRTHLQLKAYTEKQGYVIYASPELVVLRQTQKDRALTQQKHAPNRGTYKLMKYCSHFGCLHNLVGKFYGTYEHHTYQF